MSEQDQYRYMAQQPQSTNANQNYTNADNVYSYPDYSSGNSSSQQQVLYDEHGEHREHAGYSDYGATEYYAGGEKLQPLPQHSQRKGRGRGWLWYLIVPLLIIVMMGGYGASHSFDQHEWPMMGKHYNGGPMGGGFNDGGDTAQHNYKLPTSAIPQLNITDSNGSVHVHFDQDNTSNEITVTVTTDGSENANDVPVNFDNNTETLTVRDAQNGQGGYNVDISVPNTVNLTVVDNTGDVQLENLLGQVNVQTQDGSIDLSNTGLSGHSFVKSQNGSINFDGTLNQQGSYDFESVNGSIDLSLPTNASFKLDTTGSATIQNDFGSNTVGAAPNPLLKVVSQNGEVSIKQAS